jgi:hypothetical protein
MLSPYDMSMSEVTDWQYDGTTTRGGAARPPSRPASSGTPSEDATIRNATTPPAPGASPLLLPLTPQYVSPAS